MIDLYVSGDLTEYVKISLPDDVANDLRQALDYLILGVEPEVRPLRYCIVKVPNLATNDPVQVYPSIGIRLEKDMTLEVHMWSNIIRKREDTQEDD
jgi:hypothetical protein